MEKTQDMMQEFSFLKRLKTNEFFIKRELLKAKAIPGSLKNAKNIICAKKHKNLEYIWPSKKFYSISQYKEYDFIPDIALMFGEDECEENIQLIDYAFKLGLPVYIAENGFLRGIHFFTQKTKGLAQSLWGE